MKGWGESVSTICVGKSTGNYIKYFLTFLFTFCTCCILRFLVCIVVNCVYCCHLMCICCTMCVLLLFLWLARSQYSEGPATGHTGLSWFPSVYKQMLRWFPRFQVATTCFSCGPADLNLLVTNFIFSIHVK